MAHQHNQVAGTMSEDIDEERRLYECVKKYETIVKQCDELIGIMNNGTAGMMNNGTTAPKRGRNRRGSASSRNEALVQTVTRFLHELKVSPKDTECSRRK